ncbi:CxC2 domain-containing protein [Mycena chlorophos]|uniref:CxC2 domain-containing protein n=1 Tax=Mycena chlorophos TaxID=658473 RepID=A0A8H6SKW4_MYCCL|nr:CxC2 domain-containing protein [Mycena chlorophos]
MKRTRRHSISVIDTTTFSLEDDFYLADLGASDGAEKRQGKTVRPSDPALQEWALAYRNDFLRAMLSHDGRGGEDVDLCPRCNLADHNAVYRCEDCCSSQLVCKECCLETHGRLPLHTIQEWDDRQHYFNKTTLKRLGLRVQLGHHAADWRCPKPVAARSEVVVLHDNGIHMVAFDYCGCERAEPEYLQLLRSRFFPATVRRPQTCATFACLDRLNAFSLKPKTNTFDFYDTLERLTNGAGERPLDRYHMLLRMGREWRHLLLLKRGGRFGYQSNEAENTSLGELAVLCPACPRPGVNLPEKWEDAPSETNYIYSQVFAMDACFQLKRRMVSNEARDPSLGPGFAFMVEAGPYREFLRKSTNKQEMSTCSGLKALDHSNTKFSKGYAATGVGMVVCARHEFVQPTSVGDLQKGERFSNMDYLFASMLRHISQILRKVVSYDIVCQWYKNIFERLTQLPPFLKFVLYRRFTTFVVPKLHILGHIAECRSRFNLDLTSGGGQTDAEGIERAWAAAGGLSGSTKMMGPGARSDMLDAYWSFWNWTKVIGLPAILRQRLDAAKVELQKQLEAFELFSEEQDELVPTWRQMVLELRPTARRRIPMSRNTKARPKPRFDWSSAAREEKQEAEGRASLRVLDVGPVGFLEFAFAIERQQRRLEPKLL